MVRVQRVAGEDRRSFQQRPYHRAQEIKFAGACRDEVLGEAWPLTLECPEVFDLAGIPEWSTSFVGEAVACCFEACHLRLA